MVIQPRKKKRPHEPDVPRQHDDMHGNKFAHGPPHTDRRHSPNFGREPGGKYFYNNLFIFNFFSFLNFFVKPN